VLPAIPTVVSLGRHAVMGRAMAGTITTPVGVISSSLLCRAMWARRQHGRGVRSRRSTRWIPSGPTLVFLVHGR